MTITDQPAIYPIPEPVSNRLAWTIQPDVSDVLDTVGSRAMVQITFQASGVVVPANGTEFTIWGNTFTVDDSTPFTQNTMDIDTSGNSTGINLKEMLRANFFFAKTQIENGPAGFRDTIITWEDCGEQENFTGAAMDLSALETAGATVTVTNGMTAVKVNGYVMQARLLKMDADGIYQPITKYEGFQPVINCSSVAALTIDFMEEARRTLYMELPDLTVSSEQDPEDTTAVGLFKLQVGWTYKDDNCQPFSGNFITSDPVMVYNTVFDLEENWGMKRFIYDHTEITPFDIPKWPRWLTNKPERLALGWESIAWLWLSGAYNVSLTPDTIRLTFNVYYTNGTTAQQHLSYPFVSEWQLHNFNVSPKRLLSIFSLVDLSTVSHYFVRATALDEFNSSIGVIGYETFFSVEQTCEETTDLYFLTPYGGIGTLYCDIVQEVVNQQAQEICLDVPVMATRQETARYGGYMQNQVKNQESITLRCRRNYTNDEVAYFKSFKTSPERWIQVPETGLDGVGNLYNYIAKRFLVDPGGVQIFQEGDYVELIITGKIGSEIIVQNPRNA